MGEGVVEQTGEAVAWGSIMEGLKHFFFTLSSRVLFSR